MRKIITKNSSNLSGTNLTSALEIGITFFTRDPSNIVEQVHEKEAEHQETVWELNEKIQTLQQRYHTDKSLSSAKEYLKALKTLQQLFSTEKNALEKKDRRDASDYRTAKNNLKKAKAEIEQVESFVSRESYALNMKLAQRTINHLKQQGVEPLCNTNLKGSRAIYGENGIYYNDIGDTVEKQQVQSCAKWDENKIVLKHNTNKAVKQFSDKVSASIWNEIMPDLAETMNEYNYNEDQIKESIPSDKISSKECDHAEVIRQKQIATDYLAKRHSRSAAAACVTKLKGAASGGISKTSADFIAKQKEVIANDIYIQEIHLSLSTNSNLRHQFAVIGLSMDAKINDLKTYGDEAVIVDLWNTEGNGIYPVKDILKHPNKLRHQVYTKVKWDTWQIQDSGNKNPNIDCTDTEFRKFYQEEMDRLMKEEIECEDIPQVPGMRK